MAGVALRGILAYATTADTFTENADEDTANRCYTT